MSEITFGHIPLWVGSTINTFAPRACPNCIASAADDTVYVTYTSVSSSL